MASASASMAGKERLEFYSAMSNLRGSLDVAVPGAILLCIVFACFLLPAIVVLPSPVGGNVVDANLPPLSTGHLLGTDMGGNDNLSRLLHGGRASIAIAVAVNIIGLGVGGVVGALSGFAGRYVDAAIMRVLDVFIAFPSLVLVLAVSHGLGDGVANTALALSFFSIPAFARVARAATLRLRSLPFMEAALLSGTGTVRIVLRHIAPNIVPQLITFGLLGIGIVIVIEGGLSLLGFGVQAPRPSWGNMIAHGQQSLLTDPWLALLPSSLLFLTVLSCNLFGDALRTRWSVT